MKNVLFIILTIVISCSNNGDDNKQSSCAQGDFLLTLDEPVPAIVKTVASGEPFYEGKKRFYEVNAREYLPTIFDQSGESVVRLFSKTDISAEDGSQVQLKGVISSCLTSEHGLNTNNLIAFYIIDQE